jgi:hypothetical protein
MTYSLFLDDLREPANASQVVVRSYDAFIAQLSAHGCPASISFDHDLGEGPSGYDCAKWFVEWVLDDPARLRPDFSFTVHSMNPVGRDNIIGLLQGFLASMR